MKGIANRAKVVSVIFVSAIILQVIGIVPGLEYISGSFPTHFHRVESVALVLGLFASLLVVSFSSGKSLLIALTILGSLMFYSGYKTIISVASLELSHARIIWFSVGLVMTGALAWIVFGAFRQKVVGWKSLFFSLLVADFGLIYLKLMSL